MALVFKISVVVVVLGLFALGTNAGKISRFLLDFKRSAESDDVPFSVVHTDSDQFDVAKVMADIKRQLDDVLKSLRDMERADLQKILTTGELPPEVTRIMSNIQQIQLNAMSQIASSGGNSNDMSALIDGVTTLIGNFTKSLGNIQPSLSDMENDNNSQGRENVSDDNEPGVSHTPREINETVALPVYHYDLANISKLMEMIDRLGGGPFNNNDMMKMLSELTDQTNKAIFETLDKASPGEVSFPSLDNVSELFSDVTEVVNTRLNDVENRLKTLEEDVLEIKLKLESGQRGPSTQKPSTGCPDGFVQNDDLGRCYLFSSGTAIIEDALLTCFDIYNASLVAIETKEEDDFLVNIITDKYGVEDFLTGGYKFGNSFVWSQTSSPIGYSNWGPGEPNNHRGHSEGCLEIKYYKEYGQHYWNDLPCEYAKHFICETDLKQV